jgi:hypothetical protein
MFRFADLGRVWMPVELPAGEHTSTVHLLVEVMTRRELRARERRITETTGRRLTDAPPRTPDELLQAFDAVVQAEDDDLLLLRERVLDWRGIEDPDGQPLAFSRDRLDAVLAIDALFRPIREAYFRASREGVGKNSSPGPAGTPARVQA